MSTTSEPVLEMDEENNQGHPSDHMNFLRCFLCKKSYTKPKLLPCLHSFCLSCLAKVHSEQQNETSAFNSKENVNCVGDPDVGPGESDTNGISAIICPMCKTKSTLPHSGLGGFKDNLLVIEMIHLWEEKLCHNGAKAKKREVARQVLSSKHGDVSGIYNDVNDNTAPDISSCTCIPLWKKVSNGKMVSDQWSPGIPCPTEVENADPLNNPSFCSINEQFFCIPCELIICPICAKTAHAKHSTLKFEEACLEKRQYLGQLLDKLTLKNKQYETSVLQVRNCSEFLDYASEQISEKIESRAKEMIAAITCQKGHLLDQLRMTVDNSKGRLSKSKESLENQDQRIKTAAKFTKDLLEYGNGSNLMYLTNDVSDRLHTLLKEKPAASNVTNIRLEVPQIGYDFNHMHKIFGTIKQSEIRCGCAQLLHSFALELKWPTGMATTPNKEFVVTGKMGAFEEKGKVMFFGRSGNLKLEYNLDESCIPYDTTVTDDGLILVADNAGNIHKFDAFGRKLDTMIGKFKGVGRLDTIHKGGGQFIVTSSDEQKVKIYNYNGEMQLSLPKEGSGVQLLHPHYVATNNNNDIIVSDFKDKSVLMFDINGDLKFRYSGNQNDAGELTCPSAVCCDKFNNILVADFMNDRIHMVSAGGQFLGYLLTKEDNIACPNFLSVDEEGHLFVGQYGGQIHVFQYMSFVKFM